MAKEIVIDDLTKEFNFWNDDSEKIVLKNIIFNGMFGGYLPIGSLIQIAAQSGVGKSTLALQLSKELLDLGKRVLYIDAEGGLNEDNMNKTGVFPYLYAKKSNPNGTFFVLRSCDCNEVNLAIRKFSNSKMVDFIFVDSLGALDSNLYNIGGVDANNPKVGSNAKSLKIIMNTMNRCKIDDKTTFICINHLAQSIGTYIPTESPVGGKSVLYLSDILIKLTKKSSDLEKSRKGQKVEFEAVKSRFGYGKCKVPFYIIFGRGIAPIPTYKEAMVNGAVDINGRPFLTLGGAGTGVLHLGDEDFKYRGETQLLNLISKNFKKVNSLISPDTFKVKEPEDLEYYDTFFDDTSKVETKPLPKFIEEGKIIRKEINRVYFVDEVDTTGQKCIVYYDIPSNTLVSEFDSTIEETKNPNKTQFKEVLKEVSNYIKLLT